ncbi:hypothetical protein [Tenacibaculum maritimum]|uniref:hypothetical protein n=1 Tax=Tenacibaculum maritimum TaxID=107401 RepID=UPI0013308EEA|nr:hypothetical protein [Tenacibaculum maritimum]MCD9636756.1 hypothetical protein [Tenacibaculum maritimum]
MKNLAKLILSITILMSILTLSSCTDNSEEELIKKDEKREIVNSVEINKDELTDEDI